MTTSSADPSPNPTGVWGLGAHSCAHFSSQYSEQPELTFVTYYVWYQGFLSSFNLGRDADKRPIVSYLATPAQIREDETFLTEYCVEHPDSLFVQAALKLIHNRILGILLGRLQRH